MKIFGVLVFFAFFLSSAMLYIAANHSISEHRSYECEGIIEKSKKVEPTKLFFKYSSYRWWVNFWSDSDGSLWWEIPKGQSYYETFVEEFETGIKIWDYDFRDNRKLTQLGRVSFLSGDVVLTIGGASTFTGICKAIEDK